VDREPLLEVGHALDLTGYQDGVVHQERLASLLDQLEALGFDVRAARWRQTELGPGREDNLALAPGFGMDDERQPSVAVASEQALQAPVVIRMTMGDHDRAQVFDGNAEHIEVPAESIGRQPRVVEDRAAPPLGLHREERREPVLGDQLPSIGKVVREVPVDVLRPSHQDVHEIVHHDRDFGTIDRLELCKPIARGPGSVAGDGHDASLHTGP
jgi:hypothetical protein